MDFPKPLHSRAIVKSCEHLDGKVCTVQFQMVDPPALHFFAGQYCSFFVSPSLRRTYSITSIPEDTATFRVCVDISPAGPGSSWLLGLTPGQQIEFLGPLGRFVVDKTNHRKKVFVATGTGISSIHGMIIDLIGTSPDQPIVLYWGLRYEEDIFWHEEFVRFASQHSSFVYTLTLSRPSSSWQGARGRVTDHVIQEETDLAASEFYLCGNRQMIYDMKEQLIEHDVAEEYIKTELFY